MRRVFLGLSLIVVILVLLSNASADLSVHFLDVGQGDAALVISDEHAMLIDGGPSSASQFIYSYLRSHVDGLEFIIATHPHEDHVGGLAAALNAVPVDLIFSPVEVSENSSFQNMVGYADMAGTPIVVPWEGDYFHLGDALVTVLHCWPEAWDVNDMSIVVRIDYGQTSFLFTGNAEEMSEYMMLDSGFDLKADVLKVGHHGSRSSSTSEFIQAVVPKYAAISCGKYSTYGHPHEETLRTLAGAVLLRTDQVGTIIFHSDGIELHYETEHKAKPSTAATPSSATPTLAPDMTGAAFIGNKNSMKFHYPDCSGAQFMKEKNKVMLESRDEAIERGFEPCGMCQP